MKTSRATARAETVGSLLRPAELLEAKRPGGAASPEKIHQLEDSAVLDAIQLQESVGLDVITDGEMRRVGWSFTSQVLDGFEPRPVAPGLTWHGGGEDAPRLFSRGSGAGYTTVVRPLAVRRDVTEEFQFLVQHARTRTKFCLPAPSYHRRNWYREHSSDAYPTAEAFLTAVRDYEREVVGRLVELGCDYVQLDAPNYGSLCDADHRRWLQEQGHDLEAELAFDADLDSSVFEGFAGITRALHVCRGNAAGRWHSTGGYGVIAEGLFPKLDVDVLLLEYDSDRAGDFQPLAHIRSGTVAVLGLVTTKTGGLEDEGSVEARIREAALIKPLEELALSPQCGFASVDLGNPVSAEDQRAKLELVSRLAHRVWA